ncbi:MAG: MurR/RpiR family transcriptional regulator [Gemmobacter sp.]
MPKAMPPPEPPATLDALRQLALAIARGEVAIGLGPKASAALGRILELQGSPALLSITALAAELGVNPSTLTRLARSLGYPGFGAFQDVLLNASLAGPGAFYSRQARAALAGDDPGSRARVERLCRENQANIDRFIEGFDAAGFDLATVRIAEAPRVAILGVRQFLSFAVFLAYGFQMIRADVSVLDLPGLGAAEGLAALQPGDVLVAASCAPYTGGVVEAVRAAKERGLAVVVITDRASSPLVGASDVALFVAHRTSFLSNSMTAFTACAECLINAVAARLGDSAAAALAERDRMIARLGIEVGPV